MSLDINSLNQGIYNALNVTDVTDLLGKDPDGNPALGHYKVPQGSTYPHVCYWVVTGSNEDTFSEWRDEALCQIDIWSDSNSAKECGDISKQITEEMDEAALEVGASAYFCQRQGPPRLLYEDENDIFHMILEYRIKVETSK